MSAFPDSMTSAPIVRAGGLRPAEFAAVGTALAVLGLASIWPTVISLWILWTTDPLKSVGMIVPLVSLVLILRAWEAIGWRAKGTWWGLTLLLITTVVARIQQQGILIMVVSPRWSTVLPPPSLMVLAYGSGVVLLLGGIRLYRAALFPILLLWFANPVPHVFSLLVDLPLQHASAHIARTFAMSLGHSLTPDHLRLMFTPDFGMFIAPGCNGIRGSITMGFIALVAGYVYRFRWYANALVVLGGILLGYVFNLARLCLLVIYYVVALRFPSLQNKAESADYVIGAALFLIATLLLFAVIHRLRDAGNPHLLEGAVAPEQREAQDYEPRKRVAHLAGMAVIVLLGWAGLARVRAMFVPSTTSMVGGETERERFPLRLGDYTLARSWNEIVPTGAVVYVWGQYVPDGGGTPIAIGVSPVFGWHDPLICHFVRGENPLWQGQLTIATAGSVPISFSSAFYNDGVTQYLEASTICRGGACGEFATGRTHFGFVYTHPGPKAMVGDDPMKPIPVVIRAEANDATVSADTARMQLTKNLRDFLASVKPEDLAKPFNR